MKNLQFLITALVFLFSLAVLNSCEDLGTNPEMTDAELIAAIQDATNKQSVDLDELPSGSVSELETEYPEDFALVANLAPELGYEVNLKKGVGADVGDDSQAYFNLNGRFLGDATDISASDRSDRPDKRGDKKRKAKGDCFDILFPFTLVMPDGTTITLEEEGHWRLVKEWYEANPETDQRPTFVFPIEIAFAYFDEVVTIENEEQLERAKQTCIDKRRDKKCFDLVYPFAFIMPDGSSITLNEESDWDIVKEWYESNPDVDQRPDLVFPIYVQLANGDMLTISTQDEFKRLHDACKDQRPDFYCFKYEFPISFLMPDGTTITLESREDWELIEEWYKVNPETDVRPELVFPVTITYANGESLTLNSQEELERAKEVCRDEVGD